MGSGQPNKVFALDFARGSWHNKRRLAVNGKVKKKYNLDFIVTYLIFSKIGKTPHPND